MGFNAFGEYWLWQYDLGGAADCGDSAPIKRMVQEAREDGCLIDATYGRRTQAVLIMDSDHIVLSALLPETIATRIEKETGSGEEGENE